MSKPIVEEAKLEKTIAKIGKESFTVLDFIKVFQHVCPHEWEIVVGRFGLFGGKRRYTAATYFSNRLDFYSQKPESRLVPFVKYKQGGFRDYRRTTEKERKIFGSRWIAVYKKRTQKKT